ncbi:APC family permease [Eubacteriaceae bacterium ES3]|nr:APC family permease [Eubacteriaceae bacterium ES3]
MKKKTRVSLIGAIGIGIGGMVGGGIFAVLGLSISLSKGGAPLSFAIAGFIAFLTAYSYGKLSLEYPSSGGTVKFINKGFGNGIFSGGINNLLWISYIIMLSLYASAFGTYASTLFSVSGSSAIDYHIYATMIIVIATAINYYSVKVVSEIETFAVGIKMIILLIFVGAGFYGLTSSNYLSQLSVQNWPNLWNLSIGGMVIFVAYEGFELIANVSPEIQNPNKNIMRAYLISTIAVILLYVLIAVITVGGLAFSDITNAQDYVLAEAAKPVFGNIGFTVIAVAALISTFSAINATVYGGSRVNYEEAKDDEMPREFTKMFWNEPIGLFITSILTLILVNLLDLSSISTSGSAGFLLIFMFVNLVVFRKHKELKANPFISALATFLCGSAFLGLLYQQWASNKSGVIFAIGMILLSFLIEFLYKFWEKQKT